MKKWTTLCLCLLAVFCLLLITPKASAATSGIYTYEVTNGKATVTYCNISATGAITIPDTLGGYPVTTIGDRAFYDCRRLTSITIPDSVTTIGSYAFYDCSSLKSITIGSSVTTIGDNAFSDCIKLSGIWVDENNPNYCSDQYGVLFDKKMTKVIAAPGAIKSYTIPDSVTTIGDSAFCYCRSLTNITIPDSVTTIGDSAFCGCTSLNSITIPDGVPTIGDWAFAGCTSLTNITIPDSVTSIGYEAFTECLSLNSITIGSSVTTIGSYAFTSCYGLTSVTIPDSVTDIGDCAFLNSTNLTGIWVDENNPNYCSDQYGVLFDKKMTKVIAAPGAIKSYTIPDSVTTISYAAFSDCSSLTNITIPDSVTTIDKCAFLECTSLKTVYYTGTKAQWNKISIASGNESLTDATIVYDWVCKHTFTGYVFNNNTTCTQDGTETRTCTACGKQETRTATGTATGHRFTDYISNNDTTCTQVGTETRTCKACGKQETRTVTGTATGHRFTDYISNNDATCLAKGTKTATCELCSQTDTVEDPNAVGEHVWNEGDYYPPTQKREGYTLFTCTLCGETKTEVDEGSELPEVVPSLIVKHPEAVNADTKTNVQFSVVAEGNVVSYKWQYRVYYKWFDTTMTGYNTDTLTVPATGARNGYDYHCIVTFADGTQLTSKPAELTVNTFINITDSPNDQFVALGDKGQFTAAATGEQLKYQWQYCRPGTSKWIDTAMEGAKKPTVYIETTTARDGYMYRCMFTDVAGKVSYSEPATMTVLSYKSHPQETFAAPTDTVQFTVQVNVEEGFTYQWEYSKNNGATWSATGLAGNKTATLTVPAKNKNGYQYRCVITGTQRSKLYSKSAVLHVGEALIIEDQSTDCTVQAGKNVFLMVEATNVYTYRWQYCRPGTTKWIDTTMEGATTATLKVQATANRNGYQYRCILKGLDGTEIISDVITLTVK